MKNSFVVNIEQSVYTLPLIIDKEENDKININIAETAGLEDYYPSFISLDDTTDIANKIWFQPVAWNGG